MEPTELPLLPEIWAATPAPSAQRCLQFDAALDRAVMAALVWRDLGAMACLPEAALVEGTSEIKSWLVVAAAAEGAEAVLEYLPLYRTETGVGCAMGFARWVENGAPA